MSDGSLKHNGMRLKYEELSEDCSTYKVVTKSESGK
jgi:hypothetical protein